MSVDLGTVKPIRWAGPFTNGEIPMPFTFKFTEQDVDFSGFTLDATLEDDDGTEMTFDGILAWSDVTTGTVLVRLGADDVAVPAGKLVITRRLMIWSGDAGTNRIASVEIKFNCHPAVGTPPVI